MVAFLPVVVAFLAVSTGAAANPDLKAAVVAYLVAAMGSSLGSTPANPRAWADYAPPETPYPYAIVTDLVEYHAAQSEDLAATGYGLSVIATGSLQLAFYATGKWQARDLGRQAILLLSDTQVRLEAADGRILSIFAQRAESAVVGEVSPGQPTVFVRIVTFTYVRQFPQ